eukprot:CAMPEP_0198302938 /NCGR_PEP_ID=MMETSP1449-20131203/56630_1 /TAXON_ID=420275 /ORGANISM="Attheya septentrionalis, Strain CCMP2084" /LENGTH=710 /DNA_ID=CAMNT_0044005417 /DNA_START=2204 /DNA_END=4333 /DNA_ORIENTATION=+
MTTQECRRWGPSSCVATTLDNDDGTNVVFATLVTAKDQVPRLRRNNSRRTPYLSRCIMVITVLLLLLLGETSMGRSVAAADASNPSHDWEELNYYELLGLLEMDKDSRRKKSARQKRHKKLEFISSSDIKKAYRRQAQLYHPDKQMHRRAANQTKSSLKDKKKKTKTETSMEPLSLEESTARFAKIAQAYEVLSNEQDRQEYDTYLLEEEGKDEVDHTQNSESSGRRWYEKFGGGKSSSGGTDPRSLFEKFFFGGGADDDYEDPMFHQSNYYDESSSFRGTRPSRISEATETRYDPRYGTDVMRVLRREEFIDPMTHQLTYYRVIAQEFIEEYADTRYGPRSMGFTPITDPYVIEEGRLDDNEGTGSHDHDDDFRYHKDRRHNSILYSNEYLTPSTPLMTSPNGQYYAGLTPDCELLIMSDTGDPDEPDAVVWSSDTFVPHGHQGNCVLTLIGPKLVLSLGSIDHMGRTLWFSDVPASLVPDAQHAKDGKEYEYHYFCSLDDDGSLVVYKRQGRMGESSPENENDEDEEDDPLWYKWLHREQITPTFAQKKAKYPSTYETHAAKAWKSLQKWGSRTLLRRKDRSRKGSSGDSKTAFKDQCIYATGPAGCLTPGRHVIRLAANVKRSMKKGIVQMDDTIQDLSEFWENIDFDDIFDPILQGAEKVGSRVIHVGGELVQRGLYEGRILAFTIRDVAQTKWKQWTKKLQKVRN